MAPHLIRLIRSLQWRQVVDACRRNPAEARKKGPDGEVALHVACRVGAPLHVLRGIRAAYPDAVRRKDGFGNLPLHRACRARAPLDVLRFLCEGGTEGGGGRDFGGVRAQDMDGWLPLHMAAHYGSSLEEVCYLHGLFPEGIKAETNLGHLPLHMACADGSHAPADVIRYLRAEFPEGADARDGMGKTPFDLLWDSDRSDKDAVIDALVGQLPTRSPSESSVPRAPSAVYPQHELNVSLFRLISAEHWSEVERRCRWPRPDEANLRNSLGDLPLHHASRNRAPLGAIRCLADAFPSSARTASSDEGGGGGDLPLHCACAAGAELAVVQYLHGRNPDAIRTANCRGSLPLHLSCYKNAPLDVILFLCEAYPDAVQIPDSAGYLPLHYACKVGASLEVVRYLCRAHPAATAKENRIGKTPVHYIESSSRADRDEVLAALGINGRKSEHSDDKTGTEEEIARGRRDMRKALDLDSSPPVPVPLAYLEECTSSFSDERKIGEGAFGVVYRGVDDVLRRVFAVKRIRCQYRHDGSPVDPEEARKAFRKEIAVLSHFRHPNIARLYAFSVGNDINGEQCLVYDLASNGSLEHFLRDEERRKLLNWKTRIRVALDVASALKYLHDGCSGYVCYHRDVKPANVVLKRDFTALLIDCGLSKMLPADDSHLGLSIMSSSRGGVLGSPGYWCPEYALTGSDFNSASEMFSLGIVLLELYTGRLQNSVVKSKRLNFYVKFRNKKARDKIADDVDGLAGEWDADAKASFSKLALKCISPQPERRPKIKEVVGRLEKLATNYCSIDLKETASTSKGTCTKCKNASVCGSFCQRPSSHFVCNKCARKHIEMHLGEDLIFCPIEGCHSSLTDEHILSSTSVKFLSRHLEAKYHRKYSTSTPPTKAKAPSCNHITVLFSAPLAYRVEGNEFQPIERLCFDREKELLKRVFREASRDIQLTFDTATADRLQAAIINSSSMLHYSGHGYPSYLVLEDGKGGVHWFGSDELEALMSKGDEKAPFDFVFVSACDSEMTGETFISAGVPHVVCCQQGSKLLDSAACEFTRAFYHALALGKTINDSFDAGRKAVAISPSICSKEEVKKFVLLPKDGDHDVCVFDAPVLVDEWQQNNSSRKCSIGTLPAPPEYFIGRDVDVYHVLNAVLSRRFVNIVGPPGIGRRSLAASLCHYIHDRLTTIIEVESILFVQASNDSCGIERSAVAHFSEEIVSAFSSRKTPVNTKASPQALVQRAAESIGEARVLLVLDAIQSDQTSCDYNEFAFFLKGIFQGTKHARVLMVSGGPLDCSSVGVGECVYSLPPIDLESSIQLFGIWCPHMQTEEDQQRLLERYVSRDEKEPGHFSPNCQAVPLNRENLGEVDEAIHSGNPSGIFLVANSIPEKKLEGAKATLFN